MACDTTARNDHDKLILFHMDYLHYLYNSQLYHLKETVMLIMLCILITDADLFGDCSQPNCGQENLFSEETMVRKPHNCHSSKVPNRD